MPTTWIEAEQEGTRMFEHRMPWHEQPGSPEAIAKGCTCNPELNHHGRGVRRSLGSAAAFYPDQGCPQHALPVLLHVRNREAVA